MTHILISFLGKAASSYRDANYDFGAGRQRRTKFFGIALTEEIRPDRLVLLGTTGSMWNFFLSWLQLDAVHDEALVNLDDSAIADRTTDAELAALAPAVSERLGLPVALRLIPYGRSPEEQTAILQVMANEVAERDAVTLDVTHGLRHLPMLSQMSALYLQRVKNVKLQGLYYGALEMTRNNLTPVMNLQGLLDIAAWNGAIQSFDKDGDYGVFAELIEQQLPPAAGLLREAAFFERTTRPHQARGKLHELISLISRQPLTGIAGLFAPILESRLAWHTEERLYLRQQALARLYLEHEDFLRAALIGFEAFITRLMQEQGIKNTDSWECREKAKTEYENLSRQRYPRSDEYEKYRRLRDLRNHLAHGNASPQAEIQSALTDPNRLRVFLNGLFDRLLPIEK